MACPRSTDLSQLPGLDPEVVHQLRSLWIESVEEYCAWVAAGRWGEARLAAPMAARMANPVAQAAQLLGAQTYHRLQQAQPGGALGCYVPSEQGGARLAPRPPHATRPRPPAGLPARALPSQVRLMARLAAVRDQGDRGTCVAFASVALREFLSGPRDPLSEQMLYWACKQLDGVDEPGTFLHTAMSALRQYGVCRGRTWPYQPRPIPRNESQDPPPPGALREARAFRLFNCRPIEPSVVEHYKTVLAGDEEASGMPVVVGVLVYDTWYRSVETHRTGKITLPLPDEVPVGAHAMCIVGYVDRPSVPGGGYFIVRNSWGPGWAAGSPEAAGHALLPYAYLERHALEAFTGPAELQTPLDTTVGAEPEPDSAWRPYVRTLDREARDLETRLLPVGTRVIHHPCAPEEFMEDTPARAARVRFAQLGHAWTPVTRQRVWFPEIGTLSPELRQQLDDRARLQKEYAAALETNLAEAVGRPYPEPQAAGWHRWLPCEWEPKVDRLEPLADLTDALATALLSHPFEPAGLPCPAPWREELRRLNHFRVFRVCGPSKAVHVVTAFATPLELAREAEPRFSALEATHLERIRALYDHWLATSGTRPPAFTFFSVATAEVARPSLPPLETGKAWVVLAAPLPSSAAASVRVNGEECAPRRWMAYCPPRFQERRSMRDFVDLLMPVTRRDREVWIKRLVDHRLTVDPSNVTVGTLAAYSRAHRLVEVAREPAERRSVLTETLLRLQDQAPDTYRLYRTADRQLAIRHTQAGERVTITAQALRPAFWRRHIFRLLGVTVGALAGYLAGTIQLDEKSRGLLSIAVGIPIIYLGNLIQAELNRRADRQRQH